MWFQKISIPTPRKVRKVSGFPRGSGGGGGSICLFSSGEEGTKGKYFQTVLVMRKRVTKKKTQKFTTKIYLRRIRINEHSKDILSVPWNDLSRENVPYGLPFLNGQLFERISGIKLCSNGLGYLFQNKNVICFNGLSYLFTKNVICLNGLGYLFEKKLPSIRMAWAIHLKKIVIRSNGYGYPFEN